MFTQHLKHGVRTFARQPGFTAAAVLVLAFGVGGASAIFAVVDAVMLRPLPFADPDRLVAVMSRSQARVSNLVSPLDVADLRARSRTLEDVALFSSATATVANGTQAEPVVAYRGTSSLFHVLQVSPALGRTFTAAEDRASAERVVLLSHPFWQRRFASDASIVGGTIRVDGAPAVVAGVLPASFAFPVPTDVWLPLALTTEQLKPENRAAQFLQAIGRLKPGVRLADGVQDTERVGRKLAREYPDAAESLTLISTLDYMVNEVRPGVALLESAVAFLLLIACANVSSLLLARAAARRREIAIRAAIGAGRAQIGGQLLAEGLLLGAAAGACGVLVAGWGLRALLTVLPAGFPRASTIRIDAAVEGFALLGAVVSACAASLAPAIGAGRADLVEALKGARGGASSARGGGRRLQQALIAVQVAASLVLLVGAGLAIRTLWALTTADPGFRPGGVLSARVALPSPAYDPAASVRFFDRLVHSARGEPGVVSAAAVSMAPFEPRAFGGTFTVLGASPLDAAHAPEASVRAVTGDYFRTLGIAVISGPPIVDADARGPGVAVVSETAARLYWPRGGAVGSRIRLGVDVAPGTSMDREVVGIVHDVKLRRINEDTPAVVYVPHAQYPSRTMTMVVRAAGGAAALAPALGRDVAALDRDVALREVQTLDARVAGSMDAFRFRMRMLGVFAASALGLAMIGLYSVTAYAMAQRVHEMGIRLALGAPGDHIVRLVFAEAMQPVALGAIGGGAVTIALARAVQRLVFGVSALDPATLAGVAATLAASAAIACAVPARRALRVDPVVALRD